MTGVLDGCMLLMLLHSKICGFPKIGGGTFLRVPMIRCILFWGPPIERNYHVSCEANFGSASEAPPGTLEMALLV